ncbi:FeoB-associated Cys-rich membrane protein [Clostridium polyendosporum]|nr:FeoB-associated Cys-rich membrane protein [Clostridium polyendosporum]
MEIIVTIAIVGLAAFFLIRGFIKSSKGDCSCGSCSSHCPKYDEKK